MPTMPSLADPLVQTLLPLVVAFVLAGVLRTLAGRRAAIAGAALAFLFAHVLILGLPALPPRSAVQKLAYMAAGGLLIGAVVDLLHAGRAARLVAAWAWLTVGAAWMVEARLAGPAAGLVAPGIAWAVGLVALWRIERWSGAGIRAPVMVAAAAAGLGGVTLFAVAAPVAPIARLGFALALALAGFLAWNWPVARWPFAGIGLVGLAVAAGLIAVQLATVGSAAPAALAAVALVALSADAAHRLRLGPGPLGALGHGALAALAALLAIGLAVLVARG